MRVVSVPVPRALRAARVRPSGTRCCHPAAPRLVVEAGVSLGMAPLLRPGDRFHGLERFGASAPWKRLAEHFGFTADAVVALAREMLGD